MRNVIQLALIVYNHNKAMCTMLMSALGLDAVLPDGVDYMIATKDTIVADAENYSKTHVTLTAQHLARLGTSEIMNTMTTKKTTKQPKIPKPLTKPGRQIKNPR